MTMKKEACGRCRSFFSKFRCNSPEECDCPRCQELCICDKVEQISGKRRLRDTLYSCVFTIPGKDGEWMLTGRVEKIIDGKRHEQVGQRVGDAHPIYLDWETEVDVIGKVY